jgi:hypothetical protein
MVCLFVSYCKLLRPPAQNPTFHTLLKENYFVCRYNPPPDKPSRELDEKYEGQPEWIPEGLALHPYQVKQILDYFLFLKSQ